MTSGSVIFRDVKQELKLRGKGQSRTSVLTGCTTRIPDFLQHQQTKTKTVYVTKHTFCSVLCPRRSRPPTQFLSQGHTGNNANKAGQFSVRDAVNIF